MKTLVLILVLAAWSVPVWAEVTVIYRKSDRTVAGWAVPPQSANVEIDNITKSELGGQREDYATVAISDEMWAGHENQLIGVDSRGQVMFIQNPAAAERAMAYDSATAKLRMLGLSKEEIEALVSR